MVEFVHVCFPLLRLSPLLIRPFSSDNQAFGRVFRIGQDKETLFVKMVVEDTVDSRLLLTCNPILPVSHLNLQLTDWPLSTKKEGDGYQRSHAR
jgi:hypothetical protein